MTTPATFAELVAGLIGILNLGIPVIMSVVFVVFAWKIFDAWVLNAADEQKRTEGKQIAITGVVVMVIIITVWGIVIMLQNSIFG